MIVLFCLAGVVEILIFVTRTEEQQQELWILTVGFEEWLSHAWERKKRLGPVIGSQTFHSRSNSNLIKSYLDYVERDCPTIFFCCSNLVLGLVMRCGKDHFGRRCVHRRSSFRSQMLTFFGYFLLLQSKGLKDTTGALYPRSALTFVNEYCKMFPVLYCFFLSHRY